MMMNNTAMIKARVRAGRRLLFCRGGVTARPRARRRLVSEVMW